MDARKSKFISCGRSWFALAFFAMGLGSGMPLWGQDSSEAMGRNRVTPIATLNSPTFTATNSPTVTPSPTSTFNPFATPTWTFTPGSPTDTPTNTNTPIPTATFTPTGTLTPSVTPTPTWSSTPSISRASLALFPTAYSNAWDRTDGFNWDIGFTYFIGTIAEREKSEANSDWLNPLRLWVLTSDVKYAWLEERGDMPGIASGVLLSELLNGGGGSTGGTTASGGAAAPGQNSTSFQLTGNSVGGVYTVASKTIAPGMAVHFGYIYGFNQAFQSLGIGDFAPHLNYSALLPLFTPKLNNLVIDPDPPNVFYTGFNTKMLGTNWKFEVWKPFPMDQNPIMFDSQIDGLFAFNLGYMRWDEGYAVLGYFNFRFTIIPVTPEY